MNKTKLTLNVILLLWSCFALAQTDSSKIKIPEFDGQVYPVGKNIVQELYHQQNFDQWNYINGNHYQPYNNSRETNPYINFKFGEGSIYIDGICYDDLILAYDIYKDELINIPRKQEISTFYVNINKSTIDSFVIRVNEGEHKLINVEKHPCNIPDAKGFYEISEHKHFTMFFKHKMALTDDGGLDMYVYALSRKMFVNDQLFNIKSKTAFLKHFPDYKKEIKKKLRTYEVGFRKLNAVQLIEVLNYVESLQSGRND